MSELLNSPRFVRRVSWAAALLLVAGVVAFTIAYLGNTGESQETALANQPAAVADPVQRTVPLSREARIVAGEFILSAVQRDVPDAQLRKNMAKAWKLTDPNSDLRNCGGHRCTYAEWLTGDVPIQPYPADAVDKASFSIDESFPDRAVLQVALLPKDGTGVEGQIFYIGLKKQKGRWLVDYWSPRAIVARPETGEGF